MSCGRLFFLFCNGEFQWYGYRACSCSMSKREPVKNTNRPSKSKENIAIPVLLYVVIMGSAYLWFPPNPDKITISMDLIMTFRVAGAFTIGIFWGLMGIILGSFWDKLKLHETRKITSV